MKPEVQKLNYPYDSLPKQRIQCCNLCGNESFTLITHEDRYGYKATATSCNRCTLTVLNPVMVAEEYAKFYESIYRPLITAHLGRAFDPISIQDMQRAYSVDRARFLEPYLQGLSGKNMLDIGGSTGVVSAHFRKVFGLHPSVIDPAPLEIEQAKSMGLETITGFIEDFEPKGKKFHFVGMFQTIDHLLDVSATLKKVHEILSDEGYFFVDIVDFRAAYLRNHKVEKAVKIDHPYYLTDYSTRKYLEKFGFAVHQTEFSADHLHIGYLCRKSTPSISVTFSADVADEYFKELRWIQNTAWMKEK